MFYKIDVFKNFIKFTGIYSLLIKLRVPILQLHGKKKLRYRCFLVNFARYLRCLFYRTFPSNCICSTEIYFTNKIVKSILKIEKKNQQKQLVRKTTAHAGKKLNTTYIKYSYTFTIQKFFIPLFIATHNALKARMQFHWGYIYYRRLFLTLGNLTLISVNARIFVINAWNSKTVLEKVVFHLL